MADFKVKAKEYYQGKFTVLQPSGDTVFFMKKGAISVYNILILN